MMQQFFQSFLLLGLVGAAIGLAIRLLLPRALAWRGVWFTWHTKFGPALVFDSEDEDGTTVRLLNVGGTFQSVCYVDEDLLWDPVCEYHRSWAHVVHLAWPKNRSDCHASMPEHSALVMGGGGYSFPKWLVAYRQDFTCTTIEIDPAIVQIAREHFFLNRLIESFCTERHDRLDLITGDAWSCLSAGDTCFDLIVNDAFRGNKPMGRVHTLDGVRLIHTRLTAHGVYIGNVRTPLEGKGSVPLWEAADAFARVFNYVWIIPERPETSKKPGNNALVAAKTPLDLGTISGAVPYLHEGKGEDTWQAIS